MKGRKEGRKVERKEKGQKLKRNTEGILYSVYTTLNRKREVNHSHFLSFSLCVNTIREPLIIKFDTFTVSYTLNTVSETPFFFLKEGLYLYIIGVWTQVFRIRNIYVTVVVGFYKRRMNKNPFV